MRRAVPRAALLVLGAGAIALGGCGGSGKTTGHAAAQQLEREDLAAVAHMLISAEPSIRAEVATTKAAWALVANGLPADIHAVSPSAIQAAAGGAAKLKTPPLFEEHAAASITGVGALLAAEIRNFITLSTRGWQMIEAAVEQIEHGPAASGRFARANVNLYIASVYDAHYSLAQIGKQLLAAYKKLGGPTAFGASLTQQEVDALALDYSEANDRLHPHDGVKLGS